MFARSGSAILAVDISSDLLERAWARGLPSERVRFLERRFEECEVEGPFDAVIGSSVLHHLDMRRALPRIVSLLAPGGRMCFAEPNYLNPQVFAERIPFLRRWMRHISPDETAFVRFLLAGTLRRAGLVEVEILPSSWLHPATPGCLIGAWAPRAASWKRRLSFGSSRARFSSAAGVRADPGDRPAASQQRDADQQRVHREPRAGYHPGDRVLPPIGPIEQDGKEVAGEPLPRMDCASPEQEQKVERTWKSSARSRTRGMLAGAREPPGDPPVPGGAAKWNALRRTRCPRKYAGRSRT